MSAWPMFAGLDDGLWWHAGEEWYVREYGHDPRPVMVEESPTGTYWGWLGKDDDAPSMVWPRRMLFDMCFPYGPEAEEKAGKGRILHLDIRHREPGDPGCCDQPPERHPEGCDLETA